MEVLLYHSESLALNYAAAFVCKPSYVYRLRRSTNLPSAGGGPSMSEPATKKWRSGASGWVKYNQKRAETGIRLDSYRGLVNGYRHNDSTVVVSSTQSLASTDVVST